MIHTDNNRQVALACYSGSVDNHYPKYPLLRLFKDTSQYYLKLHLKIRWKLFLMLSQMALQEDKELRSYIQILHPPRHKYCAHTRLCSSTVWTCISNQLFLDVSQPLNVLANSTYCSQTVSLLETARFKPSLPLVSFHGDFSPFRRLSDNKLNHFHNSCSSPFSLAWSVSTCDAQANVLASFLSLILFVFMPLKNLRDFFIKMQNPCKYYSLTP